MILSDNLEMAARQIRLYTLKELKSLGFGHFGGSLSIVEALAVIYGKHLAVEPQNPDDPNRDYFVLSKGHGGPALYATLFLKGFFTEDRLYTLNQNGTTLPSHPDRNLTPGVEMTTGSLGQGISVAGGIAFGNMLAGRDNYTYVIVGDGELNEGQCWEAFQFIGHHRLDHLIVFIDDNKKQLDGLTADIIDPLDLEAKMQAFGFHTEKVDGKSTQAIDNAIQKAKNSSGKPYTIVLDTVKGQGVTHIEEKADNHHLRPNDADWQAINDAILELEDDLKGVRA
ncbi:transketolase [Listeria weihenstephanensis FSL R9-0317]|uniref:Carbohydrate degradation protein n=1 Tax=Listeria weihenstephanensis TaxID=1006155 RepID=A0A1S7FWA4_9LIST|nr:transketolase [Listeria weihenstephanensis]AQY51734.1 carbohydrate degradation protein [Listeria weihenstephanensis]EUJ41252.1 transketolase [Listeria weihenstephanensis FSL R9-0317]